MIISAVAPTQTLPLLWIWPVLVWSRLGTQRQENRVDLLLGAYPPRLFAEWTAGVVFTALVGLVPVLRDLDSIAGWVGGVLFIPSLALAVGLISRTQRLFQAIYVPLWYLVFSGVDALDYMGILPAGPHPLLVGASATVLLGFAVMVGVARHARR